MTLHTEVAVRLYITHFECSPTEITRILRLSPTGTWRAGDLIGRSKTLRNKVNGWRLHSPLPETTGPEEQIEALFRKVRPAAPRFKKLPKNVKVQLLVAIHACDDSQRTMEISAETIQILAQIRGTLSFEYWDSRITESI